MGTCLADLVWITPLKSSDLGHTFAPGSSDTLCKYVASQRLQSRRWRCRSRQERRSRLGCWTTVGHSHLMSGITKRPSAMAVLVLSCAVPDSDLW